jgi:uncharacterized protein
MRRNIKSLFGAATLLHSITMPVKAAPSEMTIPGPQGNLAGTLLQTNAKQPLVLIIPGSGPTDRDGNNPMGVSSASYRLLAEDLAKQGIASLRIDKRGMFGSKAAIADPNAVTIDAYADDVRNWAKAAQSKTKRKCVWLLGHSEGGLVALKAAQVPDNVCGVITVSAPGRSLQLVLKAQLAASPANAPILPDANKAVDELSAGRKVDVSAMHPALQQLFAPSLQGFLINMFAQDPAKLAAQLTMPLAIIQGDKDLQVSVGDAEALARAQPKAKLILIAGMTHVLKHVDSADPAANFATYSDATKAVDPDMVDAIVEMIKRQKR